MLSIKKALLGTVLCVFVLCSSVRSGGIPGITLRSMNIEDDNLPLPEYQAVVGGRAELPCNITQHSTEDKVSLILWYREEARAPIYSVDARNSPLEKAKHFPGNMLGSRAYFETISKPTVLRVEPVQEKDAGIYRCRVDYRWARTFTTSLMLNVIVPPKETVIVDEDGQELSGMIGPYDEDSELTLRCESLGGNPPPTVTWWRGSTLLDDTFQLMSDGVVRNDLTIPELKRTDLMTVLTCNANNNNVTVAIATSVKLNLNLKPLEARIISPRRTLSAGKRAEIECIARGSRPASKITWWLGENALLNTSETIPPNGNHTTSVLKYWPSGEDHGKYLACRAENPQLLGRTVEDGWTLNVSYIPRVTLSLRAYGKQQATSEGSDVHFLCDVKSNPHALDIGWSFEGRMLFHNPKFGVVISNNSLILKKVQREHRGRYQCHATNMEGRGESEYIYLKIMYSPVCQPGQKIVYGVAKEEPARVDCEVDAEPSDVSFRWSFNNTFEQRDLLSFTSTGPRSVATYIPRTLADFGSLYCWARNSVGEQQTPCIFTVIPAGPPESVRNCTVTNYTADSVTVECEEGYDGGLQQRFHLEVYNQNQEYLEANVTSRTNPSFIVPDLPSSTEYALVLYAANVKGRSSAVVLRVTTARAPRSEHALSTESINIILGVMIGVVAALVFVAGIAVFIIRMREEEREAGAREGPSREKDAILLKKNLVESSEHDGKDPDVIPPQNVYCAEMEQPEMTTNMLLPPADYMTGADDRQNYRIDGGGQVVSGGGVISQEMGVYDPISKQSGLYEAGYTGSLQRNLKHHRQEAYIEYCPQQAAIPPNLSQYEGAALPYATLDHYHRRGIQVPMGGGSMGVEVEEDQRRTPATRGRGPVHNNPAFHGNRDFYTPPRCRKAISTPV